MATPPVRRPAPGECPSPTERRLHRAPTAQSPQIAIDIQSTGLLTACDGAMVENSDVEKGSLTCSIANENGGAIGTSARCPNQRPAVDRMENGMRNFAEAASHNSYRTRGPNLLADDDQETNSRGKQRGLPDVIGDGLELNRHHFVFSFRVSR